MQKDEFAEYVREFLPGIDETLAAQQKSVSSRPLSAAIFFVEHIVVSVEGEGDGDPKKDFHDKKWFAILYHHIQEWYMEFYGDRLNNSDNKLSGVVFLNSTPFKLRMPVTRAEPEETGELSWMTFPVKIGSEESLESLFDYPPKLSMLPVEEFEALRGEVAEIVASTRTLNLNLMTAGPIDNDSTKLRSSVLGHLESATSEIVKNTQESRSLAMWELHMVAEKSMKILLKQKGVDFPKTHEIDHLAELAEELAASGPIKEHLKNTLAGFDAIKYRYCEGGYITTGMIHQLYKSTVEIAKYYTAFLDRVADAATVRIQYKKPPWLSLPSG